MSNQPIEEKCNWREEFDEKFGVFSTNVNKRPLTSKAIESFIENLLEQERKIMAGAIEMSKLGWIDEGRIEERKRMSEEIEKRKMDGYCKDENCSHDECGTIRWFNKGLNISLSIINK